uniref:sodium:solute symporter family transporter n=1 Tax=Klebsiella pneumoniae TaxID=573 RepID=UPI0013C2F9CD
GLVMLLGTVLLRVAVIHAAGGLDSAVSKLQQIDPALMSLLMQEAPTKITDLGDKIAISHRYIERLMVPLNIWLE